MRWWRKTSVGLKVAVIATVVLALSIVGVLAAEQRNSSNQDNAAKARETGGSTPKPADDARFRGKPLELGTVAKISPNYRVAVTEVTRYEVPGAQLLAATIDATYIGKEDGEPWADLDVEFGKAGSPAFGESDCPFDRGDLDPSGQPTLETGDDTTYVVCMDVPAKTIEGGKILVEEAFSNDDHTLWSTKGAVTKALPSPAPRPSVPQAPAAPPRGQSANANNADIDEYCEDYEDDVDRYKDGIEDWDKLYEQADDDDQDEYEAWKDKMDRIVAQYNELC